MTASNTPGASKFTRRLLIPGVSNIIKLILGYDIFISYSRRDSLDYAYSVAQHFVDKGYDCYIDQLSSTRPGGKISGHIIRAIYRSRGFVLIGSAGAQASKEGDPIAQEIDYFLRYNNDRFLIPESIDGALNTDRVKMKLPGATAIEEKIFGLALIHETGDNLRSGTPGPGVMARIENSLVFTRKKTRLRYLSFGVLLVTVVLSGIALLMASKAGRAIKAQQVAQDSIKRQELRLGLLQRDNASAKEELAVRQGLLLRTTHRLEQEQQNVVLARALYKVELSRSARLKQQADTYLSVARLRAESAKKFLAFIEGGIQSLYRQPSFTDFRPANITQQAPLTIYMYTDRADMSQLKPENLLLLDSLADRIKGDDRFIVRIEGHASRYKWLNQHAEQVGNDDAGAAELISQPQAYSKDISLRFVQTVTQYLVNKGVPRERIRGRAWGQSRGRYPLDFMNNRVEVILEPAEGAGYPIHSQALR